MKKTYKIVAFSFLILCFLNCNFKGQTHRSGNLEAEPLSDKQLAKLKVFDKSNDKPFLIEIKDYNKMLSTEIVEDLNFVKLETNAECLISRIDKVFFVDDKFFVFDRSIAKNIFIFDKNGKFLNKIKQIGEGPNEIKSPKSLIVDEQSKKIIVFDDFQHKLVYYDFDLKPINQKIIPYRFNDFQLLNKEQMIFAVNCNHNDHIPEISNFNLLLIDKNNNIIRKGFEYNKDKPQSNFGTYNFLNKSDDGTILFSPRFSNSVFKISASKQIHEYLKIDFHERELPNENYTKNFIQVANFLKKTEDMYYYFSGKIIENKEIIALKLSTGKFLSEISIFWDKKSQKYVYGKPINNLFNFIFIPNSSFDDHFISFLSCEQLLKTKDKLPGQLLEIAKSSKLDDNPVIVTYKLNLSKNHD